MLTRKLLGVLIALASTLAAQIATIDPAQPGFLPGSGQKALIRDSQGHLWALGALDLGTSRPISLYRSTDGGATWSLTVAAGLNGPASGETGANLVNLGQMAIDDQDRLHITWKQSYYPSFFQSFYNTYHIPTATVGVEVNLNTAFGISTASRDASSAVAIDASGTVWITAPSASSWREQLLRSAVPYAANGVFTSVGVCTGTGASAQLTRLAVDANGVVHTAFYRNTASGEVAHRAYDPVAGTWSVETAFGNTTAPQDNYTDLCSDYLGNVFALYVVDASGGSATVPVAPTYELRTWNSGVWSAPVTLATFSAAQIGVNSTRVADIACNEGNGDVWFVVRDFAAAGALSLFNVPLGGSPAFVTDITVPSTTDNLYITPFLRGALHPSFDNTLNDVAVAWREGTVSPFSYQFWRLGTGPFAQSVIVGSGCAGSLAAPTLTSGLPVLGSLTFTMTLAGGPPNQLAYLFGALAPPAASPFPVGGGCQVWLDLNAATALIALGVSPVGPLTLDPSGTAAIPFPLANNPGLAGFPLSFQGFMTDPGISRGFVLTNALALTLGY